MARALITGASGFIGHHLAAALIERGDQVTALVRRSSQTSALTELGAQLVAGDISDPDSLAAPCAGAEVVYHLAGLTKARSRRQFFAVNEQGARNVVAACAAAAQPPVLVNVSSLAAAGPAVDGVARREQQRPAPVSVYGASKRAGELAVAEYADRVPVTVVRPPIVFGPRDRACLAMVRPIQRTGIHVIPGWRKKMFSLIHAAELVQLLSRAAEAGERLTAEADDYAHGYYFAECERRVSYGELGTIIAHSLGRISVPLPLPHALVYGVGAVAQIAALPLGIVPPLNLDKARETTAGSWICDAAKAREQLGYTVSQPLAERMQQTIDWYQRQGWI